MRANLIAAVLGAAVSSLPSVTDAGDVKLHAGTECVPMNQADISSFSGAVRAQPSTHLANVFCPIVRDNEANKTGFKMTVWVETGQMTDLLPACTVGIRHKSNALELEFETRRPAAGTSPRRLVKLDWGTSVNSGAVDAVYFLECALPTGAALLGYRIDEP